MNLTRRSFAIAGGIAPMFVGAGRVRAQQNPIRIGVLTDMSGALRDIAGPLAVASVRLAAKEFTDANPGFSVEVLVADHQNKTDVGLTVARRWYDVEGVDMITDLCNSAIALGCNQVAAEKNKVAIASSAGVSSLTGAQCTPNLVHWTQDSWNVSHTATTSVLAKGGKRWFIIAPNIAYGKAVQAEVSQFVQQAGGTVLDSAFYPFPETKDFADVILRSQSSNADVVCFAFGGADVVNFMKQAQEFGLNRSTYIAGISAMLTDVIGMGLPVGRGLILCENFYWDLNDRTRAWYQRLKPGIEANRFPNMLQAGGYAGTLHYLKAVKELGIAASKGSGREVVAMMKRMPTDDDCFGPGRIREDGRKIHPSYLFQVKAPEESIGPGDIYKLLATVPADDAFRPLSEGGCKLA